MKIKFFLKNKRMIKLCRVLHDDLTFIKGVEKKTRTFENHSDETVSPAKNMLEGWFI